MGYRSGRFAIDAIAFLDPAPKGVEIHKGVPGDERARLIVPDGADPAARILWLHGGAFCFNAPRTYSTFVAHVAKALGVSAVVPSYRLAPEHPFPAAPDDAMAAYRAAADHSKPLILAGDSAGGGLAIVTAIALRDAGERLPAGMLLASPWADLTMSGESIRSNDGKDAILRARLLPPLAKAYANGLALHDPRISPLNADLSGLPPALIQSGGHDLFLSENSELASRMESAGTRVELQVYDGMWHDFQSHAGMLPEAATAVQRMAEWAKPLLDGSETS